MDPISNPRQEAFAMRRQGMHSDGQQLASIDAQKGLASLIEVILIFNNMNKANVIKFTFWELINFRKF